MTPLTRALGERLSQTGRTTEKATLIHKESRRDVDTAAGCIHRCSPVTVQRRLDSGICLPAYVPRTILTMGESRPGCRALYRARLAGAALEDAADPLFNFAGNLRLRGYGYDLRPRRRAGGGSIGQAQPFASPNAPHPRPPTPILPTTLHTGEESQESAVPRQPTGAPKRPVFPPPRQRRAPEHAVYRCE